MATPPSHARKTSTTPSTFSRFIGPFALLVGAVGIVLAFAVSDRDGNDDVIVSQNDAIEALIPEPGSEVIRQTLIGIDLASGYEAELIINGTRIPPDEMNVLRDLDNPNESAASSGSFDTTLNRFTYQPLEGRTLPELLGDRHCVVAEYWPLSDPDDIETVEWCFTSS